VADIVESSGLGRTLPDGHFHETRWSATDIDRVPGIVVEAAAHAGREPVLGAVVQHLEVTDDSAAW
jgi:hypothetical protein